MSVFLWVFVIYYLYQTRYINIDEYKFIRKLLEDNKPTPDNEYSEFYNSIYWKKEIELPMTDNFWWLSMEIEPKTRQVRIDYITKLMINL